MDVTSKMLREVEFRERLRGYDTDEVDEFLERVAVGFDELQIELAQARSTAPPASAPATAVEQTPPPRPAIEDDDSIKRTLVLAQRTADLAIAEAKAEAEALLESARSESERLVTEAQVVAEKLESEAEVELRGRVASLTSERESLERDVRTLTDLIEFERGRLTDTVSVIAAQISGLTVSEAFSEAAANAHPVTVPPTVPVSPPPFLADAPEDAESDDVTSDLDLDLDLSISPVVERPVTTPTPTASPAADDTANAEVDEALWERWANSGDGDERRADDPFQFGRSEE